MHQAITRRDFVNATLVGAGAFALDLPAPGERRQEVHPWNGYGGIGDYAESNGNTWEVMEAAHRVRDGDFGRAPADVADTGETYDLVIVGGGFAGLGSAHEFVKARPRGTCLILDNHPVFGGEAKQNEFLVDGVKLIGPQGSNLFRVPNRGDASYQEFTELGMPRAYQWAAWNANERGLHVYKDNYSFMLWSDRRRGNGYFFDRSSHRVDPIWVDNIWDRDLAGTPYRGAVRDDFLRWRSNQRRYHQGRDLDRWLDSMSVKDYFENVMGLSPEVTRYVDPILASGLGLGCDALSAYAGYSAAVPGFPSSADEDYWKLEWLSFPGGNTTMLRYFVKAVMPDAIRGGRDFGAIATGPIDFAALDRPGHPVRMRLGATVGRVEHVPSVGVAEHVRVTYAQGDKVRRVNARAAIMASGGWINRHVVRDLPDSHRDAYAAFHHSAVLVANVALRRWRFMYDLGVTAARWFGGFGFSCNIRQPMLVGDHRPSLDPDQPAVLTFYVPFYYPGLSVAEQGSRGRQELLVATYREFERQIREQMVHLFGSGGFNPHRDIAGIVLNRWGHAYVDPYPGFYFGRDGQPAPRDVIRGGYGRIAFAHSELQGLQSRFGAVAEARRAVSQALELV